MKRQYHHILRCASIALLIVLMFSTAACSQKPKVIHQNFAQLAPICELATMKCYYHNVAEREIGENSLFRLGYQKIWIEYSGVVRVGIDASKVSIQPSVDKEDVMIVTIPKAQVLDVDCDNDSIKKVDEKHVFSKIDSQDDVEMFNEAQKDMEQTAREDAAILTQAQDRAKKVIERYIQKCGEAIGKKYMVEWQDYESVQSEPASAASSSSLAHPSISM